MKLSKEKDIVSVLLSTYNGNMFIEDQVVSIVKQNFTKFNIIIRDDGSKNTNFEFIKDISNKYNVPIVVDEKINRNLGTVKSYSRLLYETQSDYICFSDQDDVWKRDKLLNSFKRIKLLEKEHGKHTPILVHTDLSVCDNNLCKIHPSFIKYQKLDPAKKSLNYLLVQNNVTACTMMINRALKEIASPIPEKACVHDWWIALVASLFGIIDFINMPTVNYRQHDKNQIGASKYGLCHFMYRLKKLDELKHEFQAAILQATILYKRYLNYLTDEQKRMLLEFINIEGKRSIGKKITILKYKFFKQDLFRTIGLLGLV